MNKLVASFDYYPLFLLKIINFNNVYIYNVCINTQIHICPAK